MSGLEEARSSARAIYAFPKNLVLAASAGTGKTHALVGVAVHLLMGACRAAEGGLRPAVRPEALVATTFSRKAAGEIRARLHQELGRLASGDPRAAFRDDLLAAGVAAGTPLPEAEISSRARYALAGLGRAKIGTLHSFAASLARTHALLLGLSPDFDLPDEEAAKDRATAAIERVLERRAAEADTTALIQLAGGGDALIDLVRRLLSRVADDGHSAGDVEIADGDAAEIDAAFQSVIVGARDVVDDPRLGEPARALLAAHGVDPLALEDAMGDLWAVPKAGKLGAAAVAFFELRESLTHAASGKLRDRGRGFVRRWRARERLLPRAGSLRALLVACEAEIAGDNARDSVLGFTDILRAARDVLRDHPDVAAEAGAALDALLVDEFQDTSGVQRDLVQLLWEKDRRGDDLRQPGVIPGPGDLRGEGLLVVGDRKQSIYGFRGADVAVFAELCVGLAGAPAREALAIPAGLVWEPTVPLADFVALRHNRRGEPELLDFANAMSRLSLVPQRAPAELYEITYAPATEDLQPPAPRPDAPRAPRTHWLRVAVPPGKQTSSLLAEAEAIASRIGAIVRRGEVTVRGAPACWRDIAVLAPRREMLSAAAYTLAEAGIPHVVAGMGFFGAAEVRDVVAMLACLVDPDDSLSRAEVLRGPWAGATDRALVGLTDGHLGLADAGHWSAGERRLLVDAECRPAILALGRVITTLRPVLGRLGPGPALREAVRALALEETLILLPRGEQRIANVRKLLAMADLATDATELLRRLRRAGDTEQREGEAETFSDEDDAVRLLTVHGSKGLSFPIVFLPEAGAVSRGGALDPVILQTGLAGAKTRLLLRALDEVGSVHDTPSYLRAKRDLLRRDAAERLRLRYVAVTRASERMYFIGDRALPKGAKDTYDTSTAAILARLSDDEASRLSAQLDVETGESERGRVAAPGAPRPEPPAAYRRLPLAPARDVVVRLESLCQATRCARRFQLDHLAGASTSATVPDAVSELRARLAAAGEWGAAVARERPRLLHHQTLVLVDPGGELSILGTVDATVAWPDGATDLISFVAASPDPLAADLHASVLAHAATGRGAARVRVGLLAPGAPPADPIWVVPRDLDWTIAAAREAVQRTLSIPRDDLAPRVPFAVCGQLACRHVAACHPRGDAERERRGTSGPTQTSFGFFEAERQRGGGRRKSGRGRAR